MRRLPPLMLHSILTLTPPPPHCIAIPAGRGAAAAAQRRGPDAQELQPDGGGPRRRYAPGRCMGLPTIHRWCCPLVCTRSAVQCRVLACWPIGKASFHGCTACQPHVAHPPCPAADGTAGAGAAAAALGFGRAAPRSLPVPYRAGGRGLTDSGTPYIATSAGMGAAGSSWGASSLRGASPPAASPQHRMSPRPLAHNMSMGTMRGGGQGGAGGAAAGPPRPGDFARLRSKTFRCAAEVPEAEGCWMVHCC